MRAANIKSFAFLWRTKIWMKPGSVKKKYPRSLKKADPSKIPSSKIAGQFFSLSILLSQQVSIVQNFLDDYSNAAAYWVVFFSRQLGSNEHGLFSGWNVAAAVAAVDVVVVVAAVAFAVDVVVVVVVAAVAFAVAVVVAIALRRFLSQAIRPHFLEQL